MIDGVVALLLHKIFPFAVVDKVVDPQLLDTVITGVAGTAFGAATPEPDALTQPLTVCVTLYDPAVDTLIDDVAAAVLHNNVPAALVDNTEVPQLSATFTNGADGITFGFATPEPAALTQPLTDCVTVYDPAVDTVIDAAVALPVLHNNVPAALVVNTDDPQLSVTVTIGVEGTAFGAATPEPAALTQPFTVCVTLYDPAVDTVIDDVAAPVLQNIVPAALVDNTEVPQLSATVTTGADGIALGAARPEPGALMQPLTVWVTLYDPAFDTVIDDVVSPVVLHDKLPPALVLKVVDPQLLVTVTTGAVGTVLGAAVPEPAGLVQPFEPAVTV